METNWLYVALPAFIVYTAIFGYFVSKRKWTLAGLGVALANMLWVILNLVAPFRGVLDPDYRGYTMGLIHVEPGVMVTLVSGSIIVATLASACIAVSNSKGWPMAFVAVVDTMILMLISLPDFFQGLGNAADYRIELGEYLQIPGLVAVLISSLLLTFPLVAAVIWSARRIRSGTDQS